ncbi:hypothetical protein J6590_067367 [Homalodisca vitripennis]|nr:hypothetical protein J6590_067367 [Homalodisca vitripennis]
MGRVSHAVTQYCGTSDPGNRCQSLSTVLVPPGTFVSEIQECSVSSQVNSQSGVLVDGTRSTRHGTRYSRCVCSKHAASWKSKVIVTKSRSRRCIKHLINGSVTNILAAAV